MGDEVWADVLASCVAAHRKAQEELGEIDAAICSDERKALVHQYRTRDERDAAVKHLTAAHRADRAKVQADVWSFKAEVDMVTLFLTESIPYREDLDPTFESQHPYHQ